MNIKPIDAWRVDAWCVVDNYGLPLLYSLSCEHNLAIDIFLEARNAVNWEHWQAIGYRCIHVTIAPKEGG